jgi:hypothetical protein
MSSQSLNSSSNSGYANANTFTGVTSFPLRDASDFIKMKKEQVIKKEVDIGDKPKPYWISSGTQYRLSSRFGIVHCGGCAGGTPF